MGRRFICEQRIFNEFSFRGNRYVVEHSPDRVIIEDGTVLAITWRTNSLPYKATSVEVAKDGFDRAVNAAMKVFEFAFEELAAEIPELYKELGTVTAVMRDFTCNNYQFTITLHKEPRMVDDAEAFYYTPYMGTNTGHGFGPFRDVIVYTSPTRLSSLVMQISVPYILLGKGKELTLEQARAFHREAARHMAYGFKYDREYY